jgi:site-specific recombinase XerD
VVGHGDTMVAAITAGDLYGLIASHTRMGEGRAGGQDGRCAEEMAIAAYRHLWSYLVEEGLAATNVAAQLRKPLRPESLRRPIRADQAALIRQFARMSADPLLDETAITLVERLGLRPLELDGLCRADIDLAAADVVIYGKGGRPRRLPLPPGLAALVAAYLEDRLTGPALDGECRLLCRRADDDHGLVVPVGRRWTKRLFARLAAGTSAVAGLSLYSYRHALAWAEHPGSRRTLLPVWRTTRSLAYWLWRLSPSRVDTRLRDADICHPLPVERVRRHEHRALADAGHTVYAGIRDLAGRSAPAGTDVENYARSLEVDLRAVELDVIDTGCTQRGPGTTGIHPEPS